MKFIFFFLKILNKLFNNNKKKCFNNKNKFYRYNFTSLTILKH